MPKIPIPNIPYRISFYSFDLKERPHVHVRRESMECKVWFSPQIELEWNSGFADHEISVILKIIKENIDLIKKTYENASQNN